MGRRAEENARHFTEMATLRHGHAEARLRFEHKREKYRRFVREKDVDLYRNQRRAGLGLPVEFTDFTDAPTVDVHLHLDTLKAKLSVTDSETQLLRHKLERVNMAASASASAIERKL